MRRRDVIQALCGLLGVGTLATRRVRAAAPREILLARLHVAGTAYYDAEAAADRLRPRAASCASAAAREPLRCARHRGPWTGGTQAGLRAPPAQRDARPADGRRQAPICAGRIDRAARQLAEHPGLAVPGRCLNRPVDGAPGPRRTQAVLMPEPELDPGSGRLARADAPSAPSWRGKRGQQVRRWLERRGRRAVRPQTRTPAREKPSTARPAPRVSRRDWRVSAFPSRSRCRERAVLMPRRRPARPGRQRDRNLPRDRVRARHTAGRFRRSLLPACDIVLRRPQSAVDSRCGRPALPREPHRLPPQRPAAAAQAPAFGGDGPGRSPRP